MWWRSPLPRAPPPPPPPPKKKKRETPARRPHPRLRRHAWRDDNTLRSPPPQDVLDTLDRHGARTTAGIFRRPGPALMLENKLASLSSRPSPFIDTDGDVVNVHAWASLLKRLLEGLPEPLLSEALLSASGHVDTQPAAERAEAAGRFMDSMDAVHRQTMLHLLVFFKRIDATISGMGPHELARAVAPSLFGLVATEAAARGHPVKAGGRAATARRRPARAFVEDLIKLYHVPEAAGLAADREAMERARQAVRLERVEYSASDGQRPSHPPALSVLHVSGGADGQQEVRGAEAMLTAVFDSLLVPSGKLDYNLAQHHGTMFAAASLTEVDRERAYTAAVVVVMVRASHLPAPEGPPGH